MKLPALILKNSFLFIFLTSINWIFGNTISTEPCNKKLDFRNIIRNDSIQSRAVVVIGDVNMTGSKSIANILAAQNGKLSVYRKTGSKLTISTLIDDLQRDNSLIKAIQNADEVITWIGSYSSIDKIKEGGIAQVYELIKEINPRISIITFDLQLTKNKWLNKRRNLVNNLNVNLADKLIIDFHVQTNNLPFELEYRENSTLLSEETKQKLASILIKDYFNFQKPEYFYFSKCFKEEQVEEFIELKIENQLNWIEFSSTGNYKFHEWCKEEIPYKIGSYATFIPMLKKPIEEKNDKIKTTIEDEFSIIQLFNECNIPSDTLSYVAENYTRYNNFINTLPFEKRLKIAALVHQGKCLVKYKKDPLNNRYRLTPKKLQKYSERIISYKVHKDSLGNSFKTKTSRKIDVKTIDNLDVLFNMAIICSLMEDVFPDKYDAHSLFNTMLSVGAVESLNNSGVPRNGYVQPLVGNGSDFGTFQLNYSVGKALLMKQNPQFWGNFYNVDKSKKSIKFKSNYSEILNFAYMLQLTKLENGLPKEGDFENLAYQVAAWHSKTTHHRNKYMNVLVAYIKAYYKALKDNFKPIEQNDFLDKLIRDELRKKYSGKYLPEQELSEIDTFVIDNQAALSSIYAKGLRTFKNLKNVVSYSVEMKRYFPKTSSINEVIKEENKLFVDKHGDVNLYLEKGQSAYSPFQNRLPIAVKHTNKRLKERGETKHQLLLCAEKGKEIIFLNDKMPFKKMPPNIQDALNICYPDEVEKRSLFNSDIKHAYMIFRVYQKAGYRIVVRVGDEEDFRKLASASDYRNMRRYPFMTDENYFKNIEKPRFIIPFNQPVLLKNKSKYLIFTDYFKGLQELAKINEAEKRQRERLEQVVLHL